MIGCIGFGEDLKKIRKNLDQNFPFQLEESTPQQVIGNSRRYELIVIGPNVQNPVSRVQEIVQRDNLISIVILANADDFRRTKQSLQYSPFVGKNTLCSVFNTAADYSDVFANAVTRTRQKRSFSQFKTPVASNLRQLTSAPVRIDNAGSILEDAPIGALLIDSQLNVVGANKASRKIFAPESQTPTLAKLFSAQNLALFKSAFTAAQDKQLTVQDNKGHYFEVSMSQVQGEGPAHALLLLNDVTDKMEHHRRIERILESLPQMAWTARYDGTVSFLTQQWQQYTGRRCEQLLEEGWTTVIDPQDLSLLRSRWADAVKRRVTFQHAARVRRHDGAFRWHLTKAVPVSGAAQETAMWVGTCTDIHEQVTLTEDLERKVRERTRSLEETNAELEQFAYISSHDLQEPLRKILTFTSIIREDSQHSLSEHSKRYVDKIANTAQRMSRLIKDLLSFTKLNSKEAMTSVPLAEIIASVREDLELVISQVNADIRVSDEFPVVTGRHSQLKQLFYNLISNALKFRKADVNPVITITCTMLDDAGRAKFKRLPAETHYWDVIVKDNGIGFDQEYAEQIFTVFQRLHGRATYEGTGIGLAIARKVVVNHGGEIYAHAAEGEGAEFHIVLPVNNMSER